MARGGGKAGAPASLPRTPHHLRPGHAIDNLIRSLEAEWKLGLKIRGDVYSPTQKCKEDMADSVYGMVQRLHYNAPRDLEQAISTFKKSAPTLSRNKRLNELHGLLRQTIGSAAGQVTKTGTPKSGPSTKLGPSLLSSSSSSRPDRLGQPIYHESSASRTTAVDPGSPTDVESDDDLEPPPSPSPSARSTQRRLRSSPLVFSQSSAKKRLSDGSEHSRNSPKIARISEEKTASHLPVSAPFQPPSLFKKPSLDMARSFQAQTSFSSTNTSFNKSIISSQETTTTANTSFSSYNGPVDPSEPRWTKTSSTITRSADKNPLGHGLSFSEHETFIKDKQNPQENKGLQELSQGNRSTFGSIDEDGLLDASNKAEREVGLENVLMPERTDNVRPAHSADIYRGQTSSAKSRTIRLSYETNLSPAASSPPLGPSATKHSLNRPISRSKAPSADISPAKQAPQDSATEISPSKESHWIRDIPKQNLFVDLPNSKLRSIPYFVLFICQRIATASSLPLQQLAEDIDIFSVYSSPEAFWAAVHQHPNTRVSLHKPHESSRIWQAAKRQFEGYTFRGRILFQPKKTEPIFSLQLSPIRADMACRFERKFGSDRFLHLTVSVFDPGPNNKRFTKEENELVLVRWNEWLATEHHFLGRKWRVFHVKPLKTNKGGRKEIAQDKRVVLFATEGWGIQDPLTIGNMLNWFFPFARNKEQSVCKAFARLDLAFSRTVPTLVFKPSQVKRIKDKRANGEPEDSRFNDLNLFWGKTPKKKVMNDGCSEMSVGAAREIWRLYKEAMQLEDHLPLPSAFQGRIGGAKGMWMISGQTFSRDPKDIDIWITINESQLKFSPHAEDMNDTTRDPLRCTFEVRDFSSSPRSSELHKSFIPIMVDRGIPRETIAHFMNECLDADRSKLLDVLTEPLKTHDWIYRNGSKSSNGTDTSWQAGLPAFPEERINFLLESGFEPTKFEYLAKILGEFIANQHARQQKTLRAPLGKSTYLFGVADPIGVLKPGEIHVQFSNRFVDERTGDTYSNLRNLEILVARQPACRPSDIQKVRATVSSKLEHLVDVVVFSSRGECPLAGKLQGGDYDGDIFWLCWESCLVTDFKNAPAPIQDPNPEDYMIEINKQRLKDVMDTSRQENVDVDVFLKKAFEFRNQPSLLGRVTVFHEKQSYKENKISSRTLDMLCDLHDLLVDAPKQGFTFTEKHFSEFVARGLKLRSHPKEPYYKVAMEEVKKSKENAWGSTDGEHGNEKHDPSRLLDYLYFVIIRKHNKETLKQVKQLFSKATMADDALEYPYKHLTDKNHRVFKEELRALHEKFKEIFSIWGSAFGDKTTKEEENALVEECYRKFRAIRPVNENDPVVKQWLEPYAGPNSLTWNQIRASAVFVQQPREKRAHFAFKMAGRELAQMKAERHENVRHVIPRIHANMRPKRIKAPKEYEEEEDDANEDEFGSAFEYACD